MDTNLSRPRLTRGAHDPKTFAYNIVGLFSQILPLLAYLGRTLNDTMCDHGPAGLSVNGFPTDICDRCQKRLYTVGTLISGSAKAVATWTPGRIAELNARLAVAAARRLVDTVELGHPIAWAMKGGVVVTAARRAINAAAALLQDPDLGAKHDATDAARQCREMDLSTCRSARKHGLQEESFIIGYLLKASAKAAEAAAAATETGWAQAGVVRQAELAQTTENIAGAALGAALDGAALLVDTGRAEAMMVVATGVCAEFERVERAAGDTPNVPFGNSPSQAESIDAHGWWTPVVEPAALPAWLETPTEEYNVLDDFEDTELGDVADEAIGDAAALAADLERAEAILNAITEEHRAAEQVVRTTRDNGSDAGMVTEWYQECCVVCRDAKGRPMPAPCRTMKIIRGFGE